MPEATKMRPLDNLLRYEEALRLLLDAFTPLEGPEVVPLRDAAHRVLAQGVVAPLDVPGFARSAMDGYAVRHADTQGASESSPRRLRLAATLHAGQATSDPVAPGDCVQIATGAPLPPAGDAVVIVERTSTDGTHVLVRRPVGPQENVSRAGSDVRKGQAVLHVGDELTPARIAVAAALGLERLRVWPKPRILVVSTGSELREPGSPLAPGQIYDSNTYALQALLSQHGAVVTSAGIVPDELGALTRCLEEARRMDALILSGASSAGEKDLLRDALAAVGEIVFHGVQVKPGKPMLLARVGSLPVIGLPGNPASCLCDAYLFLVPAVRRMAHLPASPRRKVRARLAERVKGAPGRLFFVPARVQDGRAVPTYTESGATTSMAGADGYFEIPATVEALESGTEVDVVLF